jgi:prepilin-type processing-associated H-X9-DG protein
MTDQPTPPTQAPINSGPAAEPVKTGLAVAALVLGIVGLVVFCALVGISGIVTGIIALNRISKEPQRYGGQGMAIGGLVCGGVSLLLLPLLVAILLPSLSRARELSKRLVCASNLKGIGTTLKIYVNDDPGQGVPTLSLLVTRGEITPKQLICPSSEVDTTHYILVPGSVGTSDRGAVMAYEPKSNHGDEGGNVLFADGHVTFVRVPEYDDLIRDLLVNRSGTKEFGE